MPGPTSSKRGASPRPRRGTRGRRTRSRVTIVLTLAVLFGAGGWYLARGPHRGAAASGSLRATIVRVARHQLGYTTDPASTYCNKYSAFWFAGATDCGNSNRDEEWCADFAAWVWRTAGVPFRYQFVNGDINSSSASFYEWGVRHHTWHPASSGYVPQPGDVAVYGLDTSTLIAQHVAVVVSVTSGDRGPNAINGDGDHTGFSRVEYQADEYNADATTAGHALLSGYVSPS